MVHREHCRQEEEYTGSPGRGVNFTYWVSGNLGRCTVIPPLGSVSMITSGWWGKEGGGGGPSILPVSVTLIMLLDHGWNIRSADHAFPLLHLLLLLLPEVDLASVPVSPHLYDAGQLGPADHAVVEVAGLVTSHTPSALVRANSDKVILGTAQCSTVSTIPGEE